MSAPANKFKSDIPPQQTPTGDLLGDDIDVLDAFNKEPEPLDFILPSGFLAGTVGLAFGAGCGGKSYLNLELGMAVAGGRDADILQLEPQKTGKVLYIGREDPPLVIRHRLHSMSKHLPASVQSDIASNFRIKSSYGREFDVTKKPFRDALMKACEGVRLCMIDTLSRSHSLEENSNEDMVRLLNIFEDIAQETGAAILPSHHVNKGSGREGLTDQQSARGAVALTDNVRWGVSIVKMTKEQASKLCDPDDPGHAIDDARDRYVLMSLGTKPNYGPATAGRWLRREKGGVLVPVILDPWKKDEDGDDAPKISRAGRKYRDKEQSGGLPQPLRGRANIMGDGADEFDARFSDAPPIDPISDPKDTREIDDDCPF
jgi:hypothetical protein